MARPAAHVGLGDALPRLQPCRDARTATEACELQGSSDHMPSSGDILERLHNFQLAERSKAAPARSWGEDERLVRDSLEAFASAGGSSEADGEEAQDTALEAVASASPNAVDQDSFSLIHYAAMYGSVDVIAALLKAKANLNCRTLMHETPLQLAAYYRHADACAVLLANKARADLADWQGRTPLAAAKMSRCGNGADSHELAKARCVEMLASRLQRDEEASATKDAENLRQQGNEHFRQQHFKEAIAAYSLGLASWDDALLYSNRAECYIKLGQHAEAKMDAQKAVGLSGASGNKKASWRLATACFALGELDKAAEAASAGLAQFPQDPALLQMRSKVELERRRRRRGASSTSEDGNGAVAASVSGSGPLQA